MYLTTKKCILMLVDIIICMMVCMLSYLLTNVIGITDVGGKSFALAFVLLPVCMVLSMTITNSYNIILRYAGARDFIKCICGVVIAISAYCLGDLVIGAYELFTFKMLASAIAGFIVVMSRVAYYNYCQDRRRQTQRHDKKRTLIIGAGMACSTIINEMKESNYYPVGVVDDDKQKLKREIESVKVLGTTDDIPKICEEYDIETILFAIPSCENQRRMDILHICSETNCQVKILPYLREIVEKDNLLFQAKTVSVDDLLGREPIVFDDDDAKNLIQDKVMLVNGGGGSIGSELCRQIAKNKPKKLIILDIYENNAYNIQQELVAEYGDNLDFCVEIASVRDYKKMELIYDKYRPDVVFHAAAHKHVPLMEDNPEEAVKNNVFGTLNCAKLADKYRVKTFVLISTDKAVNPTNIMGATKRICEMIMQYMAQKTSNTKFCAVRFGNVLGSNGSVIPLFNSQIENGGPVTVTHPDIIRYFMTIPEAVSLVLKAASMAKNSEIFVLDMGKPVKILDLAEKLIKLNGYIPNVNMKIEFTGLRPGEKLYEELLMEEEGLVKTSHNKIFVGKQIVVNASEFNRQLSILNEVSRNNETERIVKLISEIVTTYHPSNEFKSMIEESTVEDEEVVEVVEVAETYSDNIKVAIG
ncbi:MAG: polysaccharide biosynthesis protein [Lachnospiraceae bacterium]|nr:polysaccharide biosynthesis protein [Lachnospiraceae bacterium]